jgi:Tol biopolymer transport system component
MKHLIIILIVVFVTFIGISGCQRRDDQTSEKKQYVYPGEEHFGEIKMLTDSGENAEAYLSSRGNMLIYQSTSGEYKCDQQFVMNLDGSNKRLVSTGTGRTTCGYIIPGDSTVIYASTHLADEACPPAPDMSLGYVWKLYDSYDIFLAHMDGTVLKRLTESGGYDAEATVSPKGEKILFTTLRDGDPEIYSMNLDGSDQTRLTFEKGYDGGPFYSWDAQKIVFRASRPKTKEELEDYNDLVKNGLVRPSVLEIYTMNADGSDMKQITNFGKASFAPFFHPDNRRIIFSSNAQSKNPRNFDLYMINIDGSGLERITYNETFDGFPVFTAEGKHLIFCSNRFNKKAGDTNVFIAEWVD